MSINIRCFTEKDKLFNQVHKRIRLVNKIHIKAQCEAKDTDYSKGTGEGGYQAQPRGGGGISSSAQGGGGYQAQPIFTNF